MFVFQELINLCPVQTAGKGHVLQWKATWLQTKHGSMENIEEFKEK